MGKHMPKYRIIEQDIRSQIQSGQLRSGDRVMTEEELCKHYDVSRMTARKALEVLALQGIVQRTAGKGTFVSPIHVRKPDSKTRSFSSDIRSIGMEPGSILIAYRVCRAKDLPDIAPKLCLQTDELVHCIERVRTANGIKIALSYTYIPYTILPVLDVRILEGSVYDYIQQKNNCTISSNRGCQTISAVIATPEQQKLLDIGDEALLQISHPTYLTDGRLFEYSITYYVGSRIVYTKSYDDSGDNYQMHPTTSQSEYGS